MFKNFDEETAINFDEEFAQINVNLGAIVENDKFVISFWQPLAQKVFLVLYSKTDNYQNIIKSFEMKKNKSIWKIKIPLQFQEYAYQFKILHQNNTITLGLDPYAKSMTPFNWKEQKLAKGILINLKSPKAGTRPQSLKTSLNNSVDPVIYELHIRDFTSFLPKALKYRKGTFLAAQEAQIFDYVKELGISHIQLLPIQSTYTINENDLDIIKKGQGQQWYTNYNWGYDPHNYFTINGWYSSDPNNAYARIKEFKKFVNSAHKKGIGIIVDVVYNHLFTNEIFDLLLPDYYFRNLKPFPVNLASLATERVMVRKLIIDSLVYFATEFNIDGFRFDLSCFIDKTTLEMATKELRKINLQIILHGEAWPWSNLPFEKSYIKGINANNLAFAYFNDSTRDAIKGRDDPEQIHKGLAHGDLTNFKSYVNAIVGNLIDFQYPPDIEHSKISYDNFATDPGMNLQYVACHDGFTLWDKINFASNHQFVDKIQQYRQALMLQFCTQGRQLILAGTELLQSKPNDSTGEETHRKHGFGELEDIFDYQPDQNSYLENSYKTTDYVNGIKWQNLKHPLVQETNKFLKKLINFRQSTAFFRMDSAVKIKSNIKLIEAKNGIIIFEITVKKEKIAVIHNLTSRKFQYNLNNWKILLQSKIKLQLIKNSVLNVEPHCSYILGSK